MKKTLVKLVVLAGATEAVEWFIELFTGRQNVIKNMVRNTAKASARLFASDKKKTRLPKKRKK